MAATAAKATVESAVSALLTEFVLSQLPDAHEIQLDDLSRKTGGLSRENWFFTARWNDADGRHQVPLILQRDPDGGLLESDRLVEFGVLDALTRTPVPTPVPYWVDAAGTWMGNPSIVVEQKSGICDLFLLNGSRPMDERLGFGHAFLELLIQVQDVDWQSVGLGKFLTDPGPNAGLHELDRWEAELRANQLEPTPELDLVLRWLREHAQPARSTVLVHGDFKPGNALVEGNQISALLDWETAHLGDPLEDLGWITNPVRGREHQIVGQWERREIVEKYSAITGFSISEEGLLWWNVFSCWKLAIIVLTGLNVFVEGRFDRVHHSPTWLVRAMFRMMEEKQ